MVNAREAERQSSGGESRWADVFKGTQRRRFLCAFGILVCQQSELLALGVVCGLWG
jgi:SP family sugar:H+ symporter-like MFS transporter